MRIRLHKKWEDYPRGTTLEVFDTKAKELIMAGIAFKYDGEYPPKEKMKTELFKPKNIKENGKD
jgi:hypothetical protein